MGTDGELARGREAARRRAWPEAFARLSAADREHVADSEDLELLATAAYLLGRVEDCLAALRRAQQGHADRGRRRRAARCAWWLSFHLSNLGDLAQASGWLARAQRLLEPEPPDCPERGYLLLPAVIERLVAGDLPAAEETAGRAAAVGGRAGDPDLAALALHLQGRALVHQGRVGDGLVLLDEAMVAVVADELSPIVAGTVYCGVIEVCQQVSELGRATEWTAALAAWCARQPDLVTFTGKCLVHRAELLHLHGAFTEAAEEAGRAVARFAAGADRYAAGAACYQQAEAHRVLGDFTAAEAAYQEASRRGEEPQPGLALLRLAQGRVDAAAAAIRRVTAETTSPPRRARLLPAQVEILLAAGDTGAARAAADELAGIAASFGTRALRAMADQARGAVLLAEGDPAGALIALRAAGQAWRELDAPYEAARARVPAGLGCRALGDEEAAAMELEAARAEFARLGAAPDLRRLATLLPRRPERVHRLTERELQVLRLLATGKTNHAIARELFLADKTVHRHVSSIFTKLGVSSRSAATAYAHRHQLV
jgi:DNA-binding NarL/FixJ family response regulator